MAPKIVLSPQVALNLENLVHVTRNQEFSGLGFCNVVDGDIHVYDIVLMDVGSAGFTEISAQELLDLERPDKANIRLWFHRHPIEGWSQTDIETMTKSPLGGIPEIVRWSASIVRTPRHWIGRLDDHIHKTWLDVEVTPNVSDILTVQAENLLDEYFQRTRKEPLVEEPPFPGGYPGSSGDLEKQYSFIDDIGMAEIDDDELFENEDMYDDEMYDDPFFFAEEDKVPAYLRHVQAVRL